MQRREKNRVVVGEEKEELRTLETLMGPSLKENA